MQQHQRQLVMKRYTFSTVRVLYDHNENGGEKNHSGENTINFFKQRKSMEVFFNDGFDPPHNF